MDLIERVKVVCNAHNVPEDHIQIYIDHLTHEAIENGDKFTDESIWNQIVFQELFWGFGSAIANYLNWEQSQH